MPPSAIAVEGISKRYTLGRFNARTLGGDIGQMFRRIGRTRGNSTEPPSQVSEFWALKDVSFSVQPGDVVGIIGRNGAGKSTLLKILSRVTAPTSGEARLRGRVASLLEVGTGFHPELTGRENIYLNGTILGMTRLEVKSKFDEIVAFAGIERFLDTPVKRYSSGMYVRLAFAVAAHLDPEILIIDEVLAVGDAVFQKKCLGKMGEVANRGRTVLFVSHNMAAVGGLCSRGIVLEGGRVAFQGDAKSSVSRYLSSLESKGAVAGLRGRTDRAGSGPLRFSRVWFSVPGRGVTDSVLTGETLSIHVEYESATDCPLRNVSLSIPFYDLSGDSLFMCWTRLINQDFETLPARGRLVATVSKFPLRAGVCRLNLWCDVNGSLSDWILDAATLDVSDGDFFRTGITPPQGHGRFVLEHSFSSHADAEG